MRNPKALEVLILLLVDKHPSINNTYSLTRFFAKSSILPHILYETLDYLVSSDHLTIVNPGQQVKSYQLTNLGKGALNSINTFEYTEDFSLKIDETGFIAKIAFLLTNKENLSEIIESYSLSNNMMIAFIDSGRGKLADSTILENYQRKKWKIKRYIETMGSIEAQEKIKQQEEKSIFQYELEGIEHSDKPTIGDSLKTIKNIS